jgi:hypothetical protein
MTKRDKKEIGLVIALTVLLVIVTSIFYGSVIGGIAVSGVLIAINFVLHAFLYWFLRD